ncbi:hypothetical protein BFN03_17045 [Rhodococcus sp. WMMA185]|uniref:hypothetical protein n=1 Tax=Rhodococcus sp. WMMA185 TaxID=679318 RepID=UPI0008780C5F|nr:hypothetical protein [Rhodococcus sp. WMMA185]AOW93782.1 hypothetical protein BFN03_17045 [Rhodococcus sp. WMMA185]
MQDAGEPERGSRGAEDYLLGTAGGGVFVFAGLALTLGAIVGLHIGHWAVMAVAVLGLVLWIVSDGIVRISRHRSRSIGPAAAPSRQPAQRAA